MEIKFVSQHRPAAFVVVTLGLLVFTGLLSARSEAAPTESSGVISAKAGPALSITSPASLIASEQTTVQAVLAGSDMATGTIIFSVYGSDDPTCSSTPLATLPPLPVDGDATYTQLILPPEAGHFPLIARYSGDQNNEAAANGCGDPGSVLNVIDPENTDACPARSSSLFVTTFPRPRPFGRSPQVMGIRARLLATAHVIAKIKPSMSYRIGGRRKTATLRTRTFRLDPAKKVRFRAPHKLIRDFKRAGKSTRRARVSFRLKVRLRDLGTSTRCFGPVTTRLINTRLTAVSRRVALRRLGPPR